MTKSDAHGVIRSSPIKNESQHTRLVSDSTLREGQLTILKTFLFAILIIFRLLLAFQALLFTFPPFSLLILGETGRSIYCHHHPNSLADGPKTSCVGAKICE